MMSESITDEPTNDFTSLSREEALARIRADPKSVTGGELKTIERRGLLTRGEMDQFFPMHRQTVRQVTEGVARIAASQDRVARDSLETARALIEGIPQIPRLTAPEPLGGLSSAMVATAPWEGQVEAINVVTTQIEALSRLAEVTNRHLRVMTDTTQDSRDILRDVKTGIARQQSLMTTQSRIAVALLVVTVLLVLGDILTIFNVHL